MARRATRVLGAAILGFAVLAVVVNGFSPRSGGRPSSSYGTSSDGLDAFASLLGRTGHTVTRLRVRPSRARLDPGQTLVVLDPSLIVRDDVSALRRFVVAGGHLITGGQDPGAWLSELMPGAPTWSAQGATSTTPLVPVPETSGIGGVQSAGSGAWTDAGGTLPAIGEPGSVLLTVASLGSGRIALLADSSPLQNRLLAHGDNAALALALAGGPGRPVSFEEAVHGYGQQSGLAALPARWKWTLIGLILAALVGVAARIRRLGPAQPPAAAVLPPRRAHVEALASALRRTEQPGAAAEPVHRHARGLVLRQAGLPSSADSATIAQAATRLGLNAAEVRALAAPVLSDADLLAAGSALAKLSGTPT